MGDFSKIKLLTMGEVIDTGFGQVLKNVLPKLSAEDDIQISHLGWHYQGQPDAARWAHENNIVIYPTAASAQDWFGQTTIKQLATAIRPDGVFTLGDPWMVGHVKELSNRGSFNWIAYMPIDRDPINQYWVPLLENPECLVLYSKWGVDVCAKEMDTSHISMIYHGVDTNIFKPLPQDVRESVRARITPDPDLKVIGTVCSNQDRKNVPAVFNIFKAWNCAEFMEEGNDNHCVKKQKFRCDTCPLFRQRKSTKASVMFLHMTDGTHPNEQGIGWNIYEMTHRFKLRGRVHMTPSLDRASGLPPEHLNMIYNAFDVHLLPTKREGFGLPVLEAQAAGVPNLTTNYSSVVELIEQGGGELIDVAAFITETHQDSTAAIVDIGDGAKKLERLLNDQLLYQRHREKGLEFAKTMTWERCADQFLELIRGVI